MRFFKQMVYGELPLGSEPLDTLGKIRTRIELINWYVGMDRENILALLRMYKKQHAEHFGVIRIGVFGSVARGTLKDGSDVDIVVELNKRNLLNRIGLTESLKNYLGLPVDVVSYRENLSPLLKTRIKRDVIYV